MKKTISIILALIIAICIFPVNASAASAVPDITAEAALVMDFTTGEILYEKSSGKAMYPASTTKIMTAILVLENMSLNTTLTADDEVASVSGSALKMRVGEKINAKDALYCMLIGSCNDIAVLFAKAISGSVEDFAKLMNEKAAELGCQNTNFVNPSGLHEEDHYSTAYDLALITRYAMQNEVFRDAVQTAEFKYTRGGGALKPGSEETITNTNWLLYDETRSMYVGNTRRFAKYEGCIGIKTGSTSYAKGCLIAAATKGNTTIMTIVLHSDGATSGSYEKFVDSIKLLDWAFENYRTLAVMRMNTEVGTLKVKKGEFNKVNAVLASDVYATLEVGQPDSSITTEVTLDDAVKAPFSRGTPCGKLDVYQDGVRIAQYDIVTASAVKEGGFFSNFGIEDATAKKIGRIILTIVILVIVAFVAYIAYLKIKSERIKKRKAARARARQEELERQRLEDEEFMRGYDQD